MDSGMTDNYLDRKHGDRWKKLNETYEKITEDTYGILVYQEQVMQVISRVAGLSESEADQIRKVIGKKRDVKEFEKYRKLFFTGCKTTGKMSPSEAETFWTGLEKWANYGFNRAHSVEYAVIAYWTAYIKYYYPREFYCAVLTHGELDPESKQKIINEILDKEYNIIGPKVKTSDPCQWIFKDNDFYIPFTEIKGIGDTAANKCCQAVRRKIRKDIFGNNIVNQGSAIDTVLDEIRAFDDDVCDPVILNKRLEFEL
jgi:DNA polymerase-3 subunit alpha